MTIDGLNIGNPPGGNQPPGVRRRRRQRRGSDIQTSGGLGESETGGLTMNVVPKTGGNRISGSVFFSGTNEILQSDNFTDEIRAAGLAAPTPYTKIYDFNGAVGGPIKQDRIWYFVNGRTQGSKRINANQWFNLNAGDATKWLYAKDVSRPGFSDRTWENLSGRVTWQANAKNKISGFWDEQATCRKCEGQTSGITDPARVSPEAGSVGATKPLRVMQASWNSPITNRLLLDAGFGGVYYGWGSFERDPNPTRPLTRVMEQCPAGCAANGGIPQLVYRSQNFNVNNTGSFSWKANAAYVTGTHSMKVGYQGTWMVDNRVWSTNNNELEYRVANGVPNQLTMYLQDYQNDGRAGWHAFFAQEQWTAGRLTLQGAVRYDNASSWFPEQTLGPSKYLPEPHRLPGHQGRGRLQRLHAAHGAGLRRVRQRQDGVEGESRQVPRGRGRLDQLRQHQPDAAHSHHSRTVRPAGRDPGVDRCRHRFPARLRPQQPRVTGSAGDRWRFLRRGLEHELGQERAHEQLRPGAPERLGRAAVGLELRGLGPAADPAPDVRRAGLSPPVVPRLHRAGQHAGGPHRVPTATTSMRRPIRDCRTAAAIEWRICSTSRPASSARSSTTSPTRARSATPRRSSTEWTSPSTCARGA